MNLKFEVISLYTLYNSDLVPSNSYFFLKLKKKTKSDEEINSDFFIKNGKIFR